jgi:site-specific DNA-methyltransferase (adenine-specific)
MTRPSNIAQEDGMTEPWQRQDAADSCMEWVRVMRERTRVDIRHGDCLEILPTLPANSIDACVTDPPYHLTSIVKRFGADNAAPIKSNGATGVHGRASTGFMGQKWDGGDIAFRPETWGAVLRVLKPGAHLVAFGAPRNYHRMACAIEDAGFEIRDSLMWIFGSGFPKSHDVSKGIDRAVGAQREVIGEWRMPGRGKRSEQQKFGMTNDSGKITAPATDAARQWQGWGTALKPSYEPIILARKPLIGTVAANVLAHGTGALNIDGCRIESGGEHMRGAVKGSANGVLAKLRGSRSFVATDSPAGRWPANVIHDGSEEVLRGFPETGAGQIGGVKDPNGSMGYRSSAAGRASGRSAPGIPDSGSAARYLYTAKADKADRLGSKHPTVKPVDLIAYLCRLITPRGGTILDPFAGSGTTGMAAMREGFRAILIEREAEYVADIKRRLAHVSGADAPLFQSPPRDL